MPEMNALVQHNQAYSPLATVRRIIGDPVGDAALSVDAILHQANYRSLPPSMLMRTLFGTNQNRALQILKTHNTMTHLDRHTEASYAARSLSQTIDLMAQQDQLTWPQRHLIRRIRALYTGDASDIAQLRNDLSVAVTCGDSTYAALRNANNRTLNDATDFYGDYLVLLKSIEKFARMSDEIGRYLLDSQTSYVVDTYITKKKVYCAAAAVAILTLGALATPRRI